METSGPGGSPPPGGQALSDEVAADLDAEVALHELLERHREADPALRSTLDPARERRLRDALES